MTNHPGRAPGSAHPGPELIQSARVGVLQTQTEAAQTVHAKLRTWQQWEAAQRSLPWSALSLWLITAVADGLLPLDDPLAVLMVRPSILARMGATV